MAFPTCSSAAGIRIEQGDGLARGQEQRGPAAADETAPERGHPVDDGLGRAHGSSFTSSGMRSASPTSDR